MSFEEGDQARTEFCGWHSNYSFTVEYRGDLYTSLVADEHSVVGVAGFWVEPRANVNAFRGGEDKAAVNLVSNLPCKVKKGKAGGEGIVAHWAGK